MTALEDLIPPEHFKALADAAAQRKIGITVVLTGAMIAEMHHGNSVLVKTEDVTLLLIPEAILNLVYNVPRRRAGKGL